MYVSRPEVAVVLAATVKTQLFWEMVEILEVLLIVGVEQVSVVPPLQFMYRFISKLAVAPAAISQSFALLIL